MKKWAYVATFICSVFSLVLFTAPAAQHRLERPLRDRVAFKNRSTRMIEVGLVSLPLALVLVSHLVISSALNDEWVSWVVTVFVAGTIGLVWWLIPLHSPRLQRTDAGRKPGLS